MSTFPGESGGKSKYPKEATYRSPLSTRYASEEMLYNWSDLKKFSTWRKLWVILAKNEKVFYSVYFICLMPWFLNTFLNIRVNFFNILNYFVDFRSTNYWVPTRTNVRKHLQHWLWVGCCWGKTGSAWRDGPCPYLCQVLSRGCSNHSFRGYQLFCRR